MVVTAFPILAWLWHGSKELLGIMQHTKCVIAHKINFFSLRQWPWHHASRCIITFAPHLIPFIGPCSAFCMSPHITWFIIVRKPGSAHVNHWDLMFLIPRRRIVYIPHLKAKQCLPQRHKTKNINVSQMEKQWFQHWSPRTMERVQNSSSCVIMEMIKTNATGLRHATSQSKCNRKFTSESNPTSILRSNINQYLQTQHEYMEPIN